MGEGDKYKSRRGGVGRGGWVSKDCILQSQAIQHDQSMNAHIFYVPDGPRQVHYVKLRHDKLYKLEIAS